MLDTAPEIMSKNPYSIEVEDLTKSYYGFKAIHALTFAIGGGEIVGFLGPNGAGKSTTMRILTGLLEADSGRARILGHSIAADPNAVKDQIGYMPENNPLPEDLRVREYLRLCGRLKGLSGGRLRRALQRVCEVCDLDRKTQRKPIRSLSKGFRQRVGIADTLLTEPPIIILDEPTIGLDPHQIRSFRALVDSLRGKHTVVISSHILPEIERICDRCVIINRGQVVACGSPRDLRARFLPGSSYEFLFEGSVFDAERLLEEVDPAIKITDSTRVGDTRTRRLLLNHPGSENLVPRILSRVASADPSPITILGLTRIEASLEDVFIAATRKDSPDTESLESAA